MAARYLSTPTTDAGVAPDQKLELVVSLTSYPKRIGNTWIALESLLRQRFKPSRIVLNLATDEFANSAVPEKILAMTSRGVEILWGENLKSHKKYLFARRRYPNAILVTADDDTVYPPYWLEELVLSYFKHPECVHCYRCHYMEMDETGVFTPYRNWLGKAFEGNGPSHRLLPTGVGGVLYPKGAIPEAACDENRIRALAPGADDIWLHFMTVMSDFPVRRVYRNNVQWPMVPSLNTEGLHSENNRVAGETTLNDRVIAVLHREFSLDFSQVK